MKITKNRAFIIHLSLSFLIFGTLIATLYFYWFPGDLFFLDGGWQGLKLVAMVDLVLGPALTLLLFSPGKKGLKFDMAAIALFQIGALAYGFYATYQQQTVALVFSEGQFNTVSHAGHTAANSKLEALGEKPRTVQDFGDRQPVAIYTAPPTGADLGRFLVDIFNGYPDPFERSDKYLDIGEYHEQLQQKQIDTARLKKEGVWDEVETTIKATGLSAENIEIYRFKARYASGYAIFSPSEMRVVDYVPVQAPDSVTASNKTTQSTTEANSDE